MATAFCVTFVLMGFWRNGYPNFPIFWDYFTILPESAAEFAA
jgi:hypothetical protein